ncbi:MAG TPA: ribosomal-processing cysteine protease Prp [Candidatus Cybelea sp.]|jgi:uncharacterized protein YsxB (DUF464 family)|nr:ribosomal-processing cysteine protease Prp [Candidatus Cybelea sp.]
MLEVIFYRDGRDRIAEVSARGHADFDEYGQDVVCAAVSAILQAARLGLETYAGVELQALQKPGHFRLRWPERQRDLESLRAIVATAELAVERIAGRFPDHVRLQRRRLTRGLGGRASGRVTSLADRRRQDDV